MRGTSVGGRRHWVLTHDVASGSDWEDLASGVARLASIAIVMDLDHVTLRGRRGPTAILRDDMPVHSVEAPARVVAEKKTDTETHLRLDGKRLVLYVEDNPANVLFMRDLLGGYTEIELVTAPSAEIGIDLARQRPPAVVIMDINLPGMSGVDALRVLKAAPETRGVPVIALTAAASERDRQRGEQAGFYRYLTKPVKVDAFEEALDAVLAPERRTQD